MPSLEIRSACIDDYAELLSLFSSLDELHHQAIPGMFRPPVEIKRTRELIETFISDENTLFLVALFGKSIVGLLHAEVRQTDHPILISTSYGHISDIAVSHGQRRKGIGKSLFNKAKEWLSTQGIYDIRLTVFAFNESAMKFYESVGFSNLHIAMRANYFE